MIHSFCLVSSINFRRKLFYLKYRDILIKYIASERPLWGDRIVFETFNHLSQQEGYYQVMDYFATLMYRQHPQGTPLQLHYPIQAPNQRSLTTATHCGIIYRLTVVKNFGVLHPDLVVAPQTDLQYQLLRLWLAANSTDNAFYQNLFYWQFLAFPNKEDRAAKDFINQHVQLLDDYPRAILKELDNVSAGSLHKHSPGHFIQQKIKNSISHFVRNNGEKLDLANLETMRLFGLSRDLLRHFCLLKLKQTVPLNFADTQTCRLLKPEEILEIEKQHRFHPH